jgi:outer membrane protein TolC
MNPRMFALRSARWCVWLAAGAALPAGLAAAQNTPPASAPPTITLPDALTRARQYGGQIQSANLAVLQAREDSTQARAARLPSVNAFNQFIYTQGNGTPSGVFVANDGVHIYNEQAVVHQELLSLVRRGELDRALAAEAIARAKVDVAVRGLNLTVIQNYYAIVVAQRKYTNTQASVQEAERFFDITQKLERGGEAAHSDVLRAQIDLQQRRRDLQEAQLAIDKAKIGLGVLIFPNFSSSFSVFDDLQQLVLLPPMAEVQNQATASSPDLTAARASIGAAGYDIRVARYGYLPSFALDFFYGIDANQFAARTQHPAANPELLYRQNLGYAAQATLNIPVWNWGATRSKIKQAELKRDQAQLDLTLAQRTLQSNVAAVLAEAQVAQAQLESLRSSLDLAVESLRLTVLRYQAGEATALEVVDSQNTLTQARNGNDDGLARYRVALTNLQILTGTL